jgi:hypothetical protein
VVCVADVPVGLEQVSGQIPPLTEKLTGNFVIFAWRQDFRNRKDQHAQCLEAEFPKLRNRGISG